MFSGLSSVTSPSTAIVCSARSVHYKPVSEDNKILKDKDTTPSDQATLENPTSKQKRKGPKSKTIGGKFMSLRLLLTAI